MPRAPLCREGGTVLGARGSITAFALALGLTVGCSRSGESPVPAARSVAASSAPPAVNHASPATAPSASVASEAPTPGPTPCPTTASSYWIRVEGDGEPYTLRAGAPRPTFPRRDCEPAAFEWAGATSISACLHGSQVRRGCLWASDKKGAYYDRVGQFWELSVTERTARPAGDALDGSAQVVGRSRAAAGELKLVVSFHVDASPDSVTTPDVWGAGEF